MAVFEFDPLVAYDQLNNRALPFGSGDIFDIADSAFATPLALTDFNDVALPALTANGASILPGFKVDASDTYGRVWWRSGIYVQLLWSPRGLMMAAESANAAAQAAAASALAAQAAAEAAVSGATVTYWGELASESLMIGLTTAVRGDWCNRADVSARFDLVAADPTNPANWARNLGGGGVGSPTWATMPAGAEGKVVGLSTATRPTTRTDVFFRWQTTDGIYPVSALPGDVWENAVEA